MVVSLSLFKGTGVEHAHNADCNVHVDDDPVERRSNAPVPRGLNENATQSPMKHTGSILSTVEEVL